MIAVLQRSNIMKKIILFVLTTLLFSLCGMISLAEENDQEIIRNEIVGQTKNEFLQNIEFSVEENGPSKYPIDGFAVSDNGTAALLHKAKDSKWHVRIISSDGTFQKTFSFRDTGFVYISWNGENFQVFSTRFEIVEYVFDENANLVHMYEITENEAWTAFFENELKPNQDKEKTVGETTYTVIEESKLIATSIEGEKIMYDGSALMFTRVLSMCFNLLLIIIGVPMGLIVLFDKVRNKY